MLPEDMAEDGSVDEPAWHASADYGPVGFPCLAYLKNGAGMFMTATADRPHQITCCWETAKTKAGLALKWFDFKPCLDLRFGPFRGQGNHSLLLGIAGDFYEIEKPDGLTFSIFYDPMCDQDGDNDPERGTIEHKRRKFMQSKARMTSAPLGDFLKEGRWWKKEGKNMSVMEVSVGLEMLLMFFGFKRRWWTSLSECPLLNNEIAIDVLKKDIGEDLIDDEDVAGDSDDAEEDGAEEDDDDAEPRLDDGPTEAVVPKKMRGRLQTSVARNLWEQFVIPRKFSRTLRRNVFSQACVTYRGR